MGGAAISLPSTLEALRVQAGEVAAVVGELLEHCQLRYDDINADARGVVLVGWSPWHWAPLPDAAQRHVGEVDRAWQSFNELAERAVSAIAPNKLQWLTERGRGVAEEWGQPFVRILTTTDKRLWRRLTTVKSRDVV